MARPPAFQPPISSGGESTTFFRNQKMYLMLS